MAAPKIASIQKKHYCPTCPGDGDKRNTMRPVLVSMPRKRIWFICNKDHQVRKSQTILI